MIGKRLRRNFYSKKNKKKRRGMRPIARLRYLKLYKEIAAHSKTIAATFHTRLFSKIK